MKNFNQYKFHASSIPALMTNSRSKKDLLSETTKSYLIDLYVSEKYGRNKDYQTINKYTQKGTMVESDSLELLEKVTKEKYFKNLKQIENDFVIGTPDVKKPVIDIKSSWDLWTFAKVNEQVAKKAYYWQILTYGWLTKQSTGQLVYALVSTPETLMQDEIYRLTFRMTEEEAESYKNCFIFDDIPAKKRIKRYFFDFPKEDIKALKEKIIICRKFMNKLSL